MAAPNERAFVPGVLPGSGGRATTAPFQFITTGEDSLRVTVINSAPGVRVAIQGRRFDQAGTVLPIAWSVTPTSDRTATTRIFPLGVGAMVNLAVWASDGAPVVGQTFVIVQIVRGHSGAVELLGTLLQGYVTGTQGLGWPGSPIVSSTDGEPYVRAVRGTTPAPGNGIVESVPTGARWELLALRFALSTSAAAATRYISVAVLDGVINPWTLVSPQNQIASEARTYSWSIGTEYQTHGPIGVAQHGLPASAILRAGAQIQCSAYYLDPADQFSAPDFIVREWLEVP